MVQKTGAGQWNDQSFIKQVEYHPIFEEPGEIINGYADEEVTNPERIVIPKPQTDLNAARALDYIVSINRKLKVLSKNGSEITVLTRTELFNNPNWPLNEKLKAEDVVKPFTITLASDLLSKSYGMLPVNDPYNVFGINRQTEETVLDSASLEDGTVRDLVLKLINEGRDKNALFRVLPMTKPSGDNYSTATQFQWSIRQLHLNQ